MTNGEKLRLMSDNDLAGHIVSVSEFQESAWSKPTWSTSDGGNYTDYNKALLDELEWLKKIAE